MRTIVFFCVLCFASIAAAQTPSNSGNAVTGIKWPTDPPVGIGTQLSTPSGPISALHIHYDASNTITWPAILRLSEGNGTNSNAFGLLALIPSPPIADTLKYSSLIRGQDLVLRENEGDLIITNFWKGNGAIRFSTFPDTTIVPPPTPPYVLQDTDFERLTILSNGNVGVNMSPGSSGLCTPIDQLQIGGGALTPVGHTSAIPGLSMYGGNRFEGMMRPDSAKTFPIQWRNISFNDYQDHVHGGSLRIAPMSSSGIAFSEVQGGLLQFNCWPYDSARGLNDKTHSVSLSMTGNDGLNMWCWRSSTDDYHQLFNVLLPDVTGGPITRNTNGLFIHHTPVLITSDTSTTASIDFTNLTHVNPLYGDGKTWVLAVNGPALFKEAFVSLDWPDYVFDRDYKLMPLPDVEQYIREHHHLPGVPSADSLAKTGVPLGQTSAMMMQKIEELTKYAIEQQKEINQLKTELQELRKER